jgi:hypothetical protein
MVLYVYVDHLQCGLFTVKYYKLPVYCEKLWQTGKQVLTPIILKKFMLLLHKLAYKQCYLFSSL